MANQTSASSPAPSPVPTVTLSQVRRFRMLRSGLIEPFATAEAAAHALFGVQAQIHPAAGLALQNRTPAGKSEFTSEQFERALWQERSLVKLWGQRGTLHVYATQDWATLVAARAENQTWWEKRPPAMSAAPSDQATLALLNDGRRELEEGGDTAGGDTTGARSDSDGLDDSTEAYSRARSALLASLRERASMGRSDVRALGLDLPEEYYSPWGGIFHNLVRTGDVCHAPRKGNEGHFAHREVWAPNLVWDPPTPEEANLMVARRYFAAFGPATRNDFMFWRYLQPALLDRTLATLMPELTPVSVAGASMLVRRDDLDLLLSQPQDADAMPVRMLYRFDPLLLAHRDRSWIIDLELNRRVSRIAGHIEGVLLDRGQIVATWRYVRKGKGLIVTVEPFAKLRKPVLQKVPKLAERVARFFGAPLQDLVYGEDTTIYKDIRRKEARTGHDTTPHPK